MTKECLMEAILNPTNLRNAQDAVRRNKGCAGIDGRSIAETEQHLSEIEAKLRATAIKLSISNFKSNAFSIAYGNLAKR